MHRHARRFADRHQAGHDRLGIVFFRVHDLGVDIGRDTAHDVVHGRNHRDRLLVRIDTRKGAGGLHDAGQALVENFRG